MRKLLLLLVGFSLIFPVNAQAQYTLTATGTCTGTQFVKGSNADGTANCQEPSGGGGPDYVGTSYTGPNADSADTGVLRLGNGEQVCWRSSPTGSNFCITGNASEQVSMGPLSVNLDGAYVRPFEVVFQNTGASRPGGIIIENLDAAANDTGSVIVHHGIGSVQQGYYGFAWTGAATTDARYELALRGSNSSIEVLRIISNATTGAGNPMMRLGPAATAPGSTLHLVSNAGDATDGIRFERTSATASRFTARLDTNGDFILTNVDDADAVYLRAAKATGIISAPNGFSGTVTAVTAASPIVSSGGTTPEISCPTCAVGGGLPAGLIAISLTSCPSGFSEVAGLVGKTLIGTNTAGGDVGTTGGSDNITPTVNSLTAAAQTISGSTDAEAAHTHTYTQVVNHVHLETAPTGQTGGQDSLTRDTSTTGSSNTALSTANPTGGVATGTTAAGSSHLHAAGTLVNGTSAVTGTLNSFDNRSAWLKVIFCQKD